MPRRQVRLALNSKTNLCESRIYRSHVDVAAPKGLKSFKTHSALIILRFTDGRNGVNLEILWEHRPNLLANGFARLNHDAAVTIRVSHQFRLVNNPRFFANSYKNGSAPIWGNSETNRGEGQSDRINPILIIPIKKKFDSVVLEVSKLETHLLLVGQFEKVIEANEKTVR